MFKKTCIALAALLFALSFQTTAFADNDFPVYTNSIINKYDGFDFELWNQRKDDNVSMKLTGGGTFECEWEAENVLFRTGKKLGSTKDYKEYGDIIIDYGADYNITSGDVSYLCIYGWTEDPLIEFYVVESYGNYKPPGGKGYKGDIEVDGGTYSIYEDTRVQQPSIQGTKTFQQYFSVRNDKRTEGTISLTEHFKAWEELGFDMSGVMYEVALCVEGYKSSGNANVYNHVMTVGDTVYGTPTERPLDLDEDVNNIETSESTATDDTVIESEALNETGENNETDEADEVNEVIEINTDDETGVISESEVDSTVQIAASDSANDSKSISNIYLIFIALGVLFVGVCVFVFTKKIGGK